MVAAGIHAPTLWAGRDPSHPEAIIACGHAHAQASERIHHCFDSVRFFYAELSGTPHDALAASTRRRECEQGQLVDEAWHLLRPDLGGDELRRVDLEVADRLAALTASVEDGYAPAHSFEHVEQADPARVQTHVVDDELGAWQQRRPYNEGRRRGEVPGHVHLSEPKRFRRRNGNA